MMKRFNLMHALFVLFVGLKLTGHITWSWLWVFAPLWGWALGSFIVGLLVGFIPAYKRGRERHREAKDNSEAGRLH